MCACVYVRAHIYIHVYWDIYVHIYLEINLNEHTRTSVCTYRYECIHKFINLDTQTYRHSDFHLDTQTLRHKSEET